MNGRHRFRRPRDENRTTRRSAKRRNIRDTCVSRDGATSGGPRSATLIREARTGAGRVAAAGGCCGCCVVRLRCVRACRRVVVVCAVRAYGEICVRIWSTGGATSVPADSSRCLSFDYVARSNRSSHQTSRARIRTACECLRLSASSTGECPTARARARQSRPSIDEPDLEKVANPLSITYAVHNVVSVMITTTERNLARCCSVPNDQTRILV